MIDHGLNAYREGVKYAKVIENTAVNGIFLRDLCYFALRKTVVILGLRKVWVTVRAYAQGYSIMPLQGMCACETKQNQYCFKELYILIEKQT